MIHLEKKYLNFLTLMYCVSWRGTAQSLMSEQEKQMMPAILTLEGGLANANSMSTEKLVGNLKVGVYVKAIFNKMDISPVEAIGVHLWMSGYYKVTLFLGFFDQGLLFPTCSYHE